MKILYFGTQNSGKSLLAQNHILSISQDKPYYIATYNNNFEDHYMQQKIEQHNISRDNNFILIEEPYDLQKVIYPNNTYLIDCISMWLFNNNDKNFDDIINQIINICKIDAKIIFVLNDISGGLVPLDNNTKEFVKRSALLGQKLASLCNEVYEVKYGLSVKLK